MKNQNLEENKFQKCAYGVHPPLFPWRKSDGKAMREIFIIEHDRDLITQLYHK